MTGGVTFTTCKIHGGSFLTNYHEVGGCKNPYAVVRAKPRTLMPRECNSISAGHSMRGFYSTGPVFNLGQVFASLTQNIPF